MHQAPVSQGRCDAGLTQHRTDAVDSEDIEYAQVGGFELDEPEDVLEKVRASKSSATTAGVGALPRAAGNGASLARSMARKTEQVWKLLAPLQRWPKAN